MTIANVISLIRLFLVPVFAVLATDYGVSIAEGRTDETLRHAALAIFIIASASDGLDGWIARRFNQRSRFGATLDPIADKALLLTALITLSVVDWGPDGWRIPAWFCALVIVRDIIIVGGVALLHFLNDHVVVKVHWTGKVCTFTQMVALGWVMLRFIPLDPIYPCAVAALFTTWSGAIYLRAGIQQIKHPPAAGSVR